jgi:hypothetical protein
MIAELLNSQVSYDISFYTMTQTITEGVLGDPVWTLYKTIKGIYWKASGSKNNISEKFKEQVSAVVIVDPLSIAESEIAPDMKITVSGFGDYKLVYADDIGGQGKVLQLNLKEWI